MPTGRLHGRSHRRAPASIDMGMLRAARVFAKILHAATQGVENNPVDGFLSRLAITRALLGPRGDSKMMASSTSCGGR
jgi:hypothetical protein